MSRRRRSARLRLVAIVVGVAALGAAAETTAGLRPLDAAPQSCDDPTQSFNLFASPMRNGRVGYGLQPGKPRIPGPTLVVDEGTCFAVTLTNDTGRRVSLHAHGVEYSLASDGTPLSRTCVRPGRTRTYVYEASLPATRPDGTIDAGSAGYWHYHDHCRGSHHGTGGLDAGLFGALIVRRPEDPVPQRRFVVVMKDISINLRRAPRTPVFKANLGERVEFVVITHGDLFHTFHLHGHSWVDNRTGIATGLTADLPSIDNKSQGPGDSFGFQIIAGEGVGPGAWMYHCHVQGHSDAGMGGIFLVRGEEGQVDEQARFDLRRWRRGHGGHGIEL